MGVPGRGRRGDGCRRVEGALVTRYRKCIAALVGATAITLPLISGGVTAAEWATILTAYATALGIYAVPNAPPV